MHFVNALEQRLATLPGVSAVGSSWTLPFAGGRCCWSFAVFDAGTRRDTMPVHLHAVTRGYLRALNVPVMRGRDLNDADFLLPPSRPEAPTAPISAIIDRAAAEKL